MDIIEGRAHFVGHGSCLLLHRKLIKDGLIIRKARLEIVVFEAASLLDVHVSKYRHHQNRAGENHRLVGEYVVFSNFNIKGFDNMHCVCAN